MRDSRTLLHRLLLWAEDSPQMTALLFRDANDQWKKITVASYFEQVVRIAVSLKMSGAKPGNRIVIYAKNSPEWIQWELGIILAGCVSVGIHPSLAVQDLKHIFGLVVPDLILVEDERYKKKAVSVGVAREKVLMFTDVIDWMQTQLANADSTTPDWYQLGRQTLDQLDLNAVHLIVFTSGTTGSPRGVQLGLKQLTAVADRITREWNLPYAEGSLFSFLPLAHVAEKVQSIGIAITNRYSVAFNTHFENIAQELKEVRPTLLLGVPRFWEQMKEKVESQRPKIFSRFKIAKKLDAWVEALFLTQVKNSLGFDRLQLAVSGAAKLPPTIGKWFQRIGISMCEIYGMSETCGLISMTDRHRLELDSTYDAVGNPPHGVEIKIEKNGEIYVKADHCFLGYFQDPVESSHVSVDGWIRTGDLGEWTESGQLKIIGRDREIIKLSNGRMIAPVPIENALKSLPDVSNACVLGEGKGALMALITLKEEVLMQVRFVPGAIEGIVVESEDLRQKIRLGLDELQKSGQIHEKIDGFIILSRDFSLEEKEITPTQKLNRRRIQEQFRYFIEGEESLSHG
jgi:long-chain acyl-CoA synthetase